MKVFFSANSPFVRKVLVSAAELQIDVERVTSGTYPLGLDPAILPGNPLGQVPTLVTADGDMLFDSRVICEYLDELAGGGKILPRSGAKRWAVLKEQSLADGALDAALSMRYEEVLRPADIRFQPWVDAQYLKVTGALDRFEADVAGLAGRVDLGSISVACLLAYLDLRFPARPWRGREGLAAWYAGFSARPSMASTAHPT